MRQDEGALLAGGHVELPVEPEAVLEDDLVLGRPGVFVGDAVLRHEPTPDVRPDAAEVDADGRWPVRRIAAGCARPAPEIEGLIDLEGRLHVGRLHRGAGLRVEVGEREQVVLAEHGRRDAEERRVEAGRRDPAALPVAPVAHLLEGRDERPAGDGTPGGDPDDAAATLGLAGPRDGSARSTLGQARRRCDERFRHPGPTHRPAHRDARRSTRQSRSVRPRSARTLSRPSRRRMSRSWLAKDV